MLPKQRQYVLIAFVISLIAFGHSLRSEARAADFFVAVNGSPSGNGSQGSPWDLPTALNHPASVQPGDTIFLRAGTYTGPFRSFLAGTASQKITLRSFPNEVAVLDNPANSALPGWAPGAGPTLLLSGNHTRYERLTITNSSTKRQWGTDYSACYPNCLGDGFNDIGNGNQIIHNVIRDVGIGIASQGSAGNGSVYYGNIMHYIGWEETGSVAPDANGRGHAFYVQNNCAGGRKRIENNIDFWSYTMSQQIYGSSGATVGCVDSIGNVLFENGRAGTNMHGGGLILGGNAGATDLQVHDNIVVSLLDCAQFPRYDAMRPAYLIAPNPLSVRNNYFRGCDAIDYNITLPALTRSGNIFVGGLGGMPSLPQSQFAGDTFFSFSGDSAVRITERWSTYDPSWGYLVISNGASAPTVNWTPANCTTGNNIQMREMMNHSGSPVQSFQCDGNPKSITMDYSGPIIAPLGNLARQPVPPSRAFRMFLLTKTADITPPSAPTGFTLQ